VFHDIDSTSYEYEVTDEMKRTMYWKLRETVNRERHETCDEKVLNLEIQSRATDNTRLTDTKTRDSRTHVAEKDEKRQTERDRTRTAKKTRNV
jgi:hypothetical protein